MTLLEYVTSLQDQGLSDEEVFAKAQEWKKKNQPKEEKVEVETIEEVKEPAVAEKDTTVTAETTEVSDTPFSDVIYGSGDSQYQEGDFNKIHEEVFGKSIKQFEKDQKKYRKEQIDSILKEHKAGTPERTIAYYQLELAPDETINKDLYSAYDKYQKEKKEGEQFSDFFTRTQQEALDLAEKQRKEKIAKMTTGEQAKAVFVNNIPIQLEQQWESTKAVFMDWISNVAGKDVADWLSGSDISESGITFIDPETNEEVNFDENPEKWKKLNSLNMRTDTDIKMKYKGTDTRVGKAAEDYIINRFKESEELQKGIIDVGNIVDKFSLEDGINIELTSGRELFGGILNAVGSTISTVVPAALTRGASLFPQVAAPMYVDYNVEKAKNLYGDTPDALDKLVQNNETEIATPLVLGGLAVGLEYVGFKGIMKNMMGKTGLMKPVATMLLTQNKEGLTEFGQSVTEEVNKGLAKGENLNVALVNAFANPENHKKYAESYAMGVVGSGVATAPTSLGRAVNSALITETQVYNKVADLIKKTADLQALRSQNSNKDFRAAIDIQINQTEQDLKDLLENNNKLTEMMTKEEQSEVLDLLNNKKENNTRLEKINKDYADGNLTAKQYGAAKGALTNSNKRITNEVDRIRANANERLLKGEIETVKDIVGEEKVNVFETVEEFVEATGQDADFDAFISPEGEIFINKERAAQVGSVTAGSHELLHRILKSTFSSNPKAALKLVEDFKSILSKKERDIIQKRIDENYADASPEVQAEEYLTSFSDAIGKGEITFTDNLKEAFMRLAKPILDIFRPKGYSKLEFESGRDVYNFIKDYQKNIKKGKISERAQKLQDLGEVDLGIIKSSVRKQEVASNEVQKIYDEQGVGGAMDIIAKFKPITNKIVEARSQAPNFDRQLLTDEIETGKRGILDLIMEYKPESGVPLAAYINKFLPARAIEASQRVLGEDFTTDVTEAKGVVAEEVTEVTVEEKPIAKKPTETVEFSQTQIEKIGAKDKAEVETRITEATNEAFKGQDIKTFGQTRNVPKAVADIYADMFGLNPQTITDKTRNYQKTDAEGLTTAKQFLLKNAANDFSRLPETKDGFGKGTFLPRNVMNALYTDGKLTGTLKDYMDLIRQKATKPIYRDAVGQTIRGLLNLHIRNRMFETLVPTTAERAVGGAKFSKRVSNIFQETYGRSKKLGVNAFEFDWNKQLNSLLKDFDVKPFDMSTPEGIDRFLTFVQTPNSQGVAPISKIPASVFIGLGFVSENALTDETIEDLKKENAFPKTIFTADGKLGELREVTGNLPFKNSAEAKTWVDSIGKDKFAKESPAFKNMMKKENVFSKKGNLANQLNNKEFQKRQEDSINELKKFFEILQNDIMRDGKDLNPEGVAFVGALLSSISTGTGHFIRKAAPMTFYQKGYFEAGPAKTTLEHTMPASLVGKYLFMQALDGKVSENFKFIKDNYFQGALLKVDDNKLKAKTKTKGKLDFNYIASMPLGWEVTDNVWARYFNSNVAKNDGGINPNSIVLKNNQTIFDKFNITSSGLIVNNETKNQMPKVEALNASSQPVALTDPQASTQQQVYNQGVLDNALNEGRKLDTPVKKFEVKQETLNELGLSTPQQIAIYVAEQASKGFNSFTFDKASLGRSKAVKDILNQIDVKSKVQVAKASKRKMFDTVVNDMIESSSGIESYKKFSAAKAKTIGRDKGRFDFITLASSAEDFKGLLYRLIGDGKKGEAQFEFLKTNLIDPYNRAEDAIVQAKISAANDFMALKEQFKGLPKTLETETGVGKFTYQHALRVYMWTKQDMSIPGLSKADARKLNKFITDDAQLQAFADQLISIQKGKPYPEPGKDWLGGNLTTDIIGGINKVNRAEYQQQWRENVEIIFSPENLNKMEAAYGTRWRNALENSLKRMKAGTNRLGYNDATSAVLDWVNNSVGAVMFLNTRSAVLQTISAVNFINWGDNNIIKAGAAFANQKQFWSDFLTLMNSDYLTQRRRGLKINVSESEIADAVKDSKNKVKAAIAYLLSKGFVFTRYADSFAIASGGATFYRNRIKKYLKEGMSQELAQEKAFNDFRDIAEESQQSSSPDKISMQQASAAGRVILNWANTPMQYVRIQKRALQDLIAGRGDAKVHISRIAYYGVIQNLIFNALQQALFAIGFGDDDEKDEKKKKAKDKKIARVANGMIDSQLKGLGIAGAAMVAAKNTLMKIYEESQKKTPEFEKAAIEALSFSPAISSKYRKIVGGLKSFSWNRKEMKEKGFSLDNPAYLAGAQIVTAFTNIPLDRVVKKINNIRGIMNEQSQMWQKVSMSLGWSAYDVGLPYYGGWDKPKEPTEAERKQQEIDVMKRDTNTAEQTQMLLDFGLTKKEIKALRYEDARVKKIIELQNKKKDGK